VTLSNAFHGRGFEIHRAGKALVSPRQRGFKGESCNWKVHWRNAQEPATSFFSRTLVDTRLLIPQHLRRHRHQHRRIRESIPAASATVSVRQLRENTACTTSSSDRLIKDTHLSVLAFTLTKVSLSTRQRQRLRARLPCRLCRGVERRQGGSAALCGVLQLQRHILRCLVRNNP
jgi:hypothetical protein